MVAKLLSFRSQGFTRMVSCQLCGRASELISSALNLCAGCIKNKPLKALPFISTAHEGSRAPYGMPSSPPRTSGGAKCSLCANNCVIREGMEGFCGLRKNEGGSLVYLPGSMDQGVVDCYYDPLPTNCVASWCCPGCTGAGYPRFSSSPNGPTRI